MARRSATPSAGVATGSSAAAVPATTTTSSSPAPTAPKAVASSSSSSGNAVQNVVENLLQHYQKSTPQRTKLLDAFMAFLVAVGVLQFVYCVLAGNYPFNAFLSGFSSTVGQFVLTASLRIQTTEANKSDFPAVSPERAFADYVVCSLILHFFCVNFIN
ncbi:oligosaccharyltransferase complex subunit epsilon [Sporothrix eucalyptigena]|uniref:Dolichyl-diphosphooligosaccharide--protein glycosyltransferase subunit OST2 n=1 Tax=Sporothrix eucalyptigena TaxID=1812306 RepID=A0ABP0CY56_9PEZI